MTLFVSDIYWHIRLFWNYYSQVWSLWKVLCKVYLDSCELVQELEDIYRALFLLKRYFRITYWGSNYAEQTAYIIPRYLTSTFFDHKWHPYRTEIFTYLFLRDINWYLTGMMCNIKQIINRDSLSCASQINCWGSESIDLFVVIILNWEKSTSEISAHLNWEKKTQNQTYQLTTVLLCWIF